jgi:hypothetical protein
MKDSSIIVVLAITFGCAKVDKHDVLPTTDERLIVYKTILDSLVTDHFYHLYLGEGIEKLDDKFDRERKNPQYQKELQDLKNLVHSDTLKQSAICLESEFTVIRIIQQMQENFIDSAKFIVDLRRYLGDSSLQHKEIYNSLISPQKQYLAHHFQPTSYKVKTTDCSIGRISFSNICLNNLRNKGLLYYEFYCGEKCGKGEILLIEKRDGWWMINKKIRLWIS